MSYARSGCVSAIGLGRYENQSVASGPILQGKETCPEEKLLTITRA
jgi:hypothetical protein